MKAIKTDIVQKNRLEEKLISVYMFLFQYIINSYWIYFNTDHYIQRREKRIVI